MVISPLPGSSRKKVPLNSTVMVQDRAMAIGKAACGGVLRNHLGEVIVAFAKEIGYCSVVITELWAIFFGLKIAWDRSRLQKFVSGI